MVPANLMLLFAAIALALAAVVTGVVFVEMRIRLIPKAEIRQSAAELRRQHGNGAESIAVTRAMEAWQRFDILEAGRWDRVAQSLRK